MTTRKFGKMKVSDINTTFQDMPPNHGAQVREIAIAIKRGDKIPPILVNRSGYLQDGRHRLAAYKLLGIKEVRVEYGTHPAAKVVRRKCVTAAPEQKKTKVHIKEIQRACSKSALAETLYDIMEEYSCSCAPRGGTAGLLEELYLDVDHDARNGTRVITLADAKKQAIEILR